MSATKTTGRAMLGDLLKATSRHRTTLSRSLVLPDVEPEDITHHSQRFFGSGRRARRPSELKTETVEVEL